MKKTVLDLGCGDHKSQGAIGIDIDPSSTDADIIADIEDLRSEVMDGVADSVVMVHSLEHVNTLRALKEAYRVLKPGGTIYVETPNAHALPILLRLLFRGTYEVCEDHVQTFGVQELRNALTKAGFTVTKWGYRDLDARFCDLSVMGLSNVLGRLIAKLLPQFGEALWVEGVKA